MHFLVFISTLYIYIQYSYLTKKKRKRSLLVFVLFPLRVFPSPSRKLLVFFSSQFAGPESRRTGRDGYTTYPPIPFLITIELGKKLGERYTYNGKSRIVHHLTSIRHQMSENKDTNESSGQAREKRCGDCEELTHAKQSTAFYFYFFSSDFMFFLFSHFFLFFYLFLFSQFFLFLFLFLRFLELVNISFTFFSLVSFIIYIYRISFIFNFFSFSFSNGATEGKAVFIYFILFITPSAGRSPAGEGVGLDRYGEEKIGRAHV